MLNPDEIERRECQHIKDPIERSRKAQQLCDKRRRQYLKKQCSFGFETVGSHSSKYEFMRQAQEAGYDVELFFISTEHPAINIERVAQRVSEGGHDVPKEKIVSRWQRTMQMLPEYLTSCNSARVLDNTHKNLRVLLSVIAGRPQIHADFYEANWPLDVLDAVLLRINMTPEEYLTAKNRLVNSRAKRIRAPGEGAPDVAD
jgi:predicted ABC-type ATPase